jgi:potassium-dependent mechanosensitive channel
MLMSEIVEALLIKLPLPSSGLETLVMTASVLAATLVLHWGFRRLRYRLRRWYQQKPEGKRPLWPVYLSVGLVCLQIALWTAAALYVSNFFPALSAWRSAVGRLLMMTFTAKVFSVGAKAYSVLNLIEVLLLFSGLWLLARGVADLFKSHILQATGANQAAQDSLALILHGVLVFLGLLIALQILGVDVSSLAIAASVIGIGIGFGLQNVANNFISGIIITFEQPIKIGDFIQAGDLVGTVERIGFRSSEIKTLDLISIIVPNSRFLEHEVINWSHGDPVCRLRVPIGLAYGSNLQRVQQALQEAAKDHPDILGFPAPQVNFRGFGENAMEFELYIWIQDPPRQFKIKSDLNYMIEASLRKHGLQVPFPQRDLHLQSPQLDQMITAWTRLHSPPEVHLYYPDSARPAGETESLASPPPELEQEPYAPGGRTQEDLDLEALANAMRGTSGVEIKDRRYLVNIYPKCFVGSEAVDWLVRNQRTTREGAIRIGLLLVNRGIIHHVLDEHSFEDKNLFYRFYADE